MNPSTFEIIAAVIFAVAILHTFAAKQIERLAHRTPRHAGLLHLLGEVEVVFGFWSIVLMVTLALVDEPDATVIYLDSRNYTEPLFVFAIMVVAASKPILFATSRLVAAIARVVPLRASVATAWLGLALVPLAGSLITEPAAMTIAALMLAPIAFRSEIPEPPKYIALGALFVNISIGGTLTSYAAPPILMVAKTWDWNTGFMLATFGWKAVIAVVINATLATFTLRKHLAKGSAERSADDSVPMPVVVVHFALLVGVVLAAHYPPVFIALLLMFLGFSQAYERYQTPPILREALLVGFFLAGLVVLGGLQEWWLQPLVSSLDSTSLFLGSLGLTAITDNAALTYLGSLTEGLSDQTKYWLVAGAVAGGGLTVIANAPNPAGASLLRHGFDDGTIGAGGLLAGAAVPTVIAAAAFAFL